MACPTCNGEGKRPHCPNCFQKIKHLEGTNGELVYLPEFLRKQPIKKVKKKRKKSVEEVLAEKAARPTSKERELQELEKEQEKQKELFLKATFRKLKLFNMTTTNSKEVDQMVLERFGPWR